MSVESAPESASVIWKSHREEQSPPDLRFLHFNDVYHVEYAAPRSSHCSIVDKGTGLAPQSLLAGLRAFRLLRNTTAMIRNTVLKPTS